MSSITVLLTTIGRPTLARTLQSLLAQEWDTTDELKIVVDGPITPTICQPLPWGSRNRCHVNYQGIAAGPHKDYGHTPRNLTMAESWGDYICHFDDDDVALPTMIADMRAAITATPTLHLFRFLQMGNQRRVWTRKGSLRRGWISTQNFLHPNIPTTFGHWGEQYGGDARFGQETAKKVGKVDWVNKITCIYSPSVTMTYEEVLAWYAANKLR